MKKKTVLALLVIILLLIAIAGISFAAFLYAKNGTNENSIELGNITFKYTENNTKGNGINIEDGFPISDSEGKVLDKYFDFKVESNLSHSDLLYEVSIEPTEESTINLDGVKVYITELDNDTEKEINSNYDINDKVKTISNYTNGVIYQERILKNTKNYAKSFRVRIWISEDTEWDSDGYIGTTGAFRINVNARTNMSMVDASVPVPVITGGTGLELVEEPQTISVVTSINPAIYGINYYEYYITEDENDIPNDETIPTGQTENEIIINSPGKYMIYYRAVVSDNNKSAWSAPELVSLKAPSAIYYLGTGRSYDIKNLLPDVDYTTLTASDFIVGTKSMSRINATKKTNGSYKYVSAYIAGFSLTKTYDPSTGILTIGGTQYSITGCLDSSYIYCSDASASGNVTPFVYLVIGGIESNLGNDKTKSLIYSLGSGTSFNLKNLFPDIDNEKLASASFIYGATSINRVNATKTTGSSHSYLSGYTSGFSLSNSYDTSTGALSIAGNQYNVVFCNDNSFIYCSDAVGNGSFSPFVYVTFDDIINAN